MTADVEDRLAAAAELAPQPVLDMAALGRAARRRRARRRLRAAGVAAVAVALVPAAAVVADRLGPGASRDALTPAAGAGEVYDAPLPPPAVKPDADQVAAVGPAAEPHAGTWVQAVAQASYRGDRYTMLRYTNTRGEDCLGWLRGGAASVTSCSAGSGSPVPLMVFGTLGDGGGGDGRQVAAGWAPSESTTLRLTFGDRTQTRHVYQGWDPARFPRYPDQFHNYFVVVADTDDPIVAMDVLDRHGNVLATRRFAGPELGQMPAPDGFVSKIGSSGPDPAPETVDVLFRHRLADGAEILLFGYVTGDGYCIAAADSLMPTPGAGAPTCGVVANLARPQNRLIPGFSSGRGELTHTVEGIAPPGTTTVVLAEPGRAPVTAATADAGPRWANVAPFYLPWHNTPGTTVTALGRDGSPLATFTPP